MEKKITTPITKGLIIALVGAVLDLIAGFAHIKYETWWRWIPGIITFGLIIWACLNYASQMENNVTFGNIFAHGFKTSAVVVCFSIIYFLISVYLIFPETKDITLQMTREQMEKDPKYTQEVIDNAVDMTRRLFIPFALIGIVFFYLIFGSIASLIGAAVAKKNPVTPFDKPQA